MKTKSAKQSSSAFFQALTPKFLDWNPPTEEEKALEVRARREVREAELKRVTELARDKEAEKTGHKKALAERSRQKPVTGTWLG